MQKKIVQVLAVCLLSAAAASHHHHARRLTDSFAWGDQRASANSTLSQANATSGGNGFSNVVATKNGTSVNAQGTEFATGNTLFAQNDANSVNSFGFNNNKNGSNNAWNSNAADTTNTYATTAVGGLGNTQLTTGSNIDGAFGGVAATHGNYSNANFLQNSVASLNNNAFANGSKRKYRLLGGSNNGNNGNNKNNNSFGWNSGFSDNSATKAATSNQTFGQGGSLISIGKKGVQTENHGSEGTISKSALQTQNNSWNNNNAWGVNNGKSFGWNDGNAVNSNTQAFTNAQTFGNGGSRTDANTDGVNMMAQGEKGTSTDAGYNNSSENWSNKNAWGNGFSSNFGGNFGGKVGAVAERRLSGRDSHKIDYKDLYEKTLKELKECKLRCKKVGASQ